MENLEGFWVQFWAMGGYALFVWPAYAAAILGLGLFAALSWQHTRRLQHRAATKRQQMRASSPSPSARPNTQLKNDIQSGKQKP